MRAVAKLTGMVALAVAGYALATARPSSAGLGCGDDTAAIVAAAKAMNRGYAWSTPSNPDPTWTIEMASVSIGFDVQAPDEATARAQAKEYLDSQIAALNCPAPPTVTITSTVATTPTVATVTQPVVLTQTSVRVETVEHEHTQTVTVPGSRKVLRITLAGARCTIHRKRVPCKRFANGVGRKVRIDGVWLGNTINARRVAG